MDRTPTPTPDDYQRIVWGQPPEYDMAAARAALSRDDAGEARELTAADEVRLAVAELMKLDPSVVSSVCVFDGGTWCLPGPDYVNADLTTWGEWQIEPDGSYGVAFRDEDEDQDPGPLRVTLLVKEGSGARDVILRRLNAWFTEGVHEPPFPPGTLLMYTLAPEPARPEPARPVFVAYEGQDGRVHLCAQEDLPAEPGYLCMGYTEQDALRSFRERMSFIASTAGDELRATATRLLHASATPVREPVGMIDRSEGPDYSERAEDPGPVAWSSASYWGNGS
jgi:hypothetical protein